MLNFFRKPKKKVTEKIILFESTEIEREGRVNGTFGIEIYDNSVAPFVESGSQYPCSGAFTFSTMIDGQDQIKIKFCFGPTGIITDDTRLGEYEISGFKERKANEASVRVYFEIDQNRIVISASDESQNQPLTIKKNK